MKYTFRTILTIAAFTLALVSCRKEYDAPPGRTIPEGSIWTIDSVLNYFNNNGTYTFTEDISIYCVALNDEVNGNFFKDIYAMDTITGSALILRLENSGGIYRGDVIRVNLNGLTVQDYNGMIQLDGLDADEHVVKQRTGYDVSAANVGYVVDINQIDDTYRAKLVQINNVQFPGADTASSWADPVGLSSVNHNLTDCSGNSIIVRSSGYANFAGSSLPNGNGSFVGIVGKFGSDYQLFIRETSELSMNNVAARCAEPYLEKNFNDGSATSGGWTNFNVSGSVDWETNDQGSPDGTDYGNISNWNGSGNDACETWLISPAVNLSTATNPILNFTNACNFSGPNLEVFVSTNYDGFSAPSSATWTQLSPTLSSGGFAFVNSGDLDLSPIAGASSVHVSFVYQGGSSDGKTWEIDNIVLEEQ